MDRGPAGSPRVASLPERHLLPGVEERDRRGLRAPQVAVGREDLERRAGLGELDRHPDVADVALEPRAPDEVRDATDLLALVERRALLGDLVRERRARGLDPDELARDTLDPDPLEGVSRKL